MRISRLLVTLGAVLLTAACATAPADDAAQAEAALGQAVATSDAAAATGDQEVECREELRTGTNFKRRVCLTKAEWAAQGRGQRRESAEVVRTRAEREAVTGANGGQTSTPPGATFP
jgi:hypothetical protein